MEEHFNTDPGTAPVPATDAEPAPTSPPRATSMPPPTHDDPLVHDDDLADHEREAEEFSELEDDGLLSEEEDSTENQEKRTPRVDRVGEKFRLSTGLDKSLLSSAAKIPLNESEQTDYSELSDSSEVEDNVSLSGENHGYGSEPEADGDMDQEDDTREDDMEEQDYEEEDNDAEEEEESETIALKTQTPDRTTRPVPKSGSATSFGRTPAKSAKRKPHFADAFITPHANKHLASDYSPAVPSPLGMELQDTTSTPSTTGSDSKNESALPSSAKVAELQSSLAEYRKRIRELEETIAGEASSDPAPFTPEKRLKISYHDSPGSRRAQQQPQTSPVKPNIIRERAPSPIRYLANIIDDIAQGVDLPSPPTKEERKADRRRRMTREFKDFSAMRLPNLKNKSPQIEALQEEEEEEEVVQVKKDEVSEEQKEEQKAEVFEPVDPVAQPVEPSTEPSIESTESKEPMVPVQEEQVAKVEDTQNVTTEPASEPIPMEVTETHAPVYIPSIPSTVFDPRRQRATSVPVEGPNHKEDESFPDISFFKQDTHTIKALEARVEELEKELSTANYALTIASQALTAERRARIEAEETRRFMEIERHVGACCHAQDQLNKFQAQLQLQQEQEGRKLEEASRKLAIEREERMREREAWEQERERLEQEAAATRAVRGGSEVRKRAPVAAPTRTGPGRPTSAASQYEPAHSRKGSQQPEDGPVRALRKRIAAEVPTATTTTSSSRARAAAATASSQHRSAATAPTAATREKTALKPATNNVLLNSQGGQAMRKGAMGHTTAKGGITKPGAERVGGPIRTIRKVETGNPSGAGRMARR